MRIAQKVKKNCYRKIDHKEEEIISGKNKERKNDQMRREINFIEYMENDKFVDNLEHLNRPEKKEVLCLMEKYREVFVVAAHDIEDKSNHVVVLCRSIKTVRIQVT